MNLTDAIEWGDVVQTVLGVFVLCGGWWLQNLFKMIEKSNEARQQLAETVYRDFVRAEALSALEARIERRFDRLEELIGKRSFDG